MFRQLHCKRSARVEKCNFKIIYLMSIYYVYLEINSTKRYKTFSDTIAKLT